jgi:putative chitinase
MDAYQIQHALKSAGYLVTVTGVMDSQTHYALMEFETDRSLGKSDGNLDPETENSLLLLSTSTLPLATTFGSLGVPNPKEWALCFEDARAWAESGGVKLSNDSFFLMLGNVLLESALLKKMEESFNYTPQGLLKTFGSRFSEHTSQLYGRTPQRPANQRMIANTAYAGKLGNGDVDSGDGWLYRGVGPIQLTGKVNQDALEKDTGINIRTTRLPEYMAKSAVHFWITRGCDKAITVNNDSTLACKRVNSALLALPQRLNFYNLLRESVK